MNYGHKIEQLVLPGPRGITTFDLPDHLYFNRAINNTLRGVIVIPTLLFYDGITPSSE